MRHIQSLSAFGVHSPQVLQLEDVRRQVVGDGGARGISGGQRKRVNLGLELVTTPALLLLGALGVCCCSKRNRIGGYIQLTTACTCTWTLVSLLYFRCCKRFEQASNCCEINASLKQSPGAPCEHLHEFQLVSSCTKFSAESNHCMHSAPACNGADEPTSGLDSTASRLVMAAMQRVG